MTSAVEVVKYIKSQMTPMGETQLHKLAYYSQAWSLAWDGKPLFNDRIEAWRNGPVAPTLRYRAVPPDAEALSPQERATVDAVIEFYGRFHGAKLGDMTHAERPWAEAWDKRPEGSTRCTEPITHEAMRHFYTELALSDEEKPVRRAVTQSVSNDEVLEVAAANAQRWAKTLELLSQ